MKLYRWNVDAEAADETDAAIVADVLAGALRDERNDPSTPVAVTFAAAGEPFDLAAVEPPVVAAVAGVLVRLLAAIATAGIDRPLELLLAVVRSLDAVEVHREPEPDDVVDVAAQLDAERDAERVVVELDERRVVEVLGGTMPGGSLVHRELAGDDSPLERGVCTNHRCRRFEYVVAARPGDTCVECTWRLEHESGLTWEDAAAAGLRVPSTERG